MLAVIEGVDGSGKQTQSELLYERLKDKTNIRKLTFPNYESETSSLVKMYLAGNFGRHASDVNAYAASSFYAVDRIGSYLSDWKTDYENGTFILCDRYTTSNAVHQAGKLSGKERDDYLDWLFSYEYGLLGLPKPDAVFFLNVPPDVSFSLMRERKNKITNSDSKDIHESDFSYIKKSYENALYVAEKCGWKVIDCTSYGKMRSISEINDEIYDMVMNLWKK